MTYALAYNPTDGPVVIDTAGRMLGGREWAAADTSDEMVKQAVAGGRLVLPAPPSKDAAAEPVQAHKDAQRLTARQREFSAADKPQLVDLAVDAGLFTDDDDPSKAELVAALTRSSVDLPVAAKAERK